MVFPHNDKENPWGRVTLRADRDGVVARRKIVDGTRVAAGDVAIALPSSGLHSNGYSLARKALLDEAGMKLDFRPAELHGKTLGEALLTPTRLYARAARAALASGADVRAMSHVTGGGIPGNLPRVLPEGLGLRIESRWERAPIFDLVQRAGGVAEAEMRRAFNVGVGYVFIVAAGDAPKIHDALRAEGEQPFALGRVVAVPPDRPFEERVEWSA